MKPPATIEAAVEIIERLNARTAANDVRIGELERELREAQHATESAVSDTRSELNATHAAKVARLQQVIAWHTRRAELLAQSAMEAVALNPDCLKSFEELRDMETLAQHDQLTAQVDRIKARKGKAK